MSSETQRCLAELTDPGLFERLATAVLREADERLRLIVHSGVNLGGKTVKGELDGITFVPGRNPPHMVAVHHTTCRREHLERKWLHDPSASPSRPQRANATPAGDVVKTAKVYATEKKQIPDLSGTLILTTNQEPSDQLVLNVTATGYAAGLEVVVWSRSALAHFLDCEPQGQWIRSKYLGIGQDRLSPDLLEVLCRRSLEASLFHDSASLWVDRELDEDLKNKVDGNVVFLVGGSGYGKSVACYKLLTEHIAGGGFGLVVGHRTVANSPWVEQAIEETLKGLHPCLSKGAGAEALKMASGHKPFMIVIEDVNRSAAPTQLMERLVSWSRQREGNQQAPNWRGFCPVWPRIWGAIGEKIRRHFLDSVMHGSSFTAKEAIAAVNLRHEQAGITISVMEAEAVASALGGDPLLIALQDPRERGSFDDVIGEFVDGSLRRLSDSRREFTPGEYRVGLRRFALKTLKWRCHDPSTEDVEFWYGDEPDGARKLRHIAQFGEIIHVSGDSSSERFVFRHDRVRQWIQTDAIADLMGRDDVPRSILRDPYFAEIVGGALVREDTPRNWIEEVSAANPLALFCALRVLGEPANKLHNSILEATESWLDVVETHEPKNQHLRWHACRILAECDASYVVRLARIFQGEQQVHWVLQAMFRNGDCLAGIKLCARYRPGVGVAGFLELIEHVKSHHGKKMFRTLKQALEGAQLKGLGRTGALRLAGHFGTVELASAVRTSWLEDSNRIERLDAYLWSGAQCCNGDGIRVLADVCDAWAALPDKAEKDGFPSPRDELAAHHIRWAFNNRLPEAAIEFFIERAKSADLQWPITYMLHGVDHPSAVEFVAGELALLDERHKATGAFSPFAATASDEWKRRQEQTGSPMSRPSRTRLWNLWADTENTRFLRVRAIQLWASTIGKDDVPILQEASGDKDIGDLVLFQRLRRGDVEAIPELVKKLKRRNDGYWWQAGRHIWSDELTECIDFALCRRRDCVSETNEAGDAFNADWILHELIMERPTRVAERLLIRHWDHVRSSPYYLQAALYCATPDLRRMVAKEMYSCSKPETMLDHICSHYGIRVQGRTGITRLDQMEALVPYLDSLSEMDIQDLWWECNRNGWLAFRHTHLDALARASENSSYWDDSLSIRELDRALKKERRFWASHWVERFVESGASSDHVMNVVRNWLEDKDEIAALEIASEIVVNCGSRAHLGILEEFGEGSAQARAVVENAIFSVRHRTMK